MKYLTILTTFLLIGCNLSKLPKERLYQYSLNTSYEFTNNELNIKLSNTLQCPMRIWIQSKDVKIKTFFNDINPVILEPLQDTIINVQIEGVEVKELSFASRFGNISKKVNVSKIELPFQKNEEYLLIQGYNSLPTHNTNWSRYAIDFGLKVGDTICAATKGFVVGVIEDYKFGGPEAKWRDFANVITIYDPQIGLFTQYVHLDYKGSLVQVGDSVLAGQKIGIAGITGFTNIEHLHFNCLEPIHSQDGLVSIPIDSIGQYRVSEMKRNQMITNKN